MAHSHEVQVHFRSFLAKTAWRPFTNLPVGSDPTLATRGMTFTRSLPLYGFSRRRPKPTSQLFSRLSPESRDEWRARWRVGPDFTLELAGTRREAANDDAPEHGLMLRVAVRW